MINIRRKKRKKWKGKEKFAFCFYAAIFISFFFFNLAVLSSTTQNINPLFFLYILLSPTHSMQIATKNIKLKKKKSTEKN